MTSITQKFKIRCHGVKGTKWINTRAARDYKQRMFYKRAMLGGIAVAGYVNLQRIKRSQFGAKLTSKAEPIDKKATDIEKKLVIAQCVITSYKNIYDTAKAVLQDHQHPNAWKNKK